MEGRLDMKDYNEISKNKCFTMLMCLIMWFIFWYAAMFSPLHVQDIKMSGLPEACKHILINLIMWPSARFVALLIAFFYVVYGMYQGLWFFPKYRAWLEEHGKLGF